jgi:hypothetical protein
VVHVCRVFSLFPLHYLKLTRVTVKTSDMGDTCPLQSFNSNSTFIMLYLVHEMVVDYLVVDELINIKTSLITIACLV